MKRALLCSILTKDSHVDVSTVTGTNGQFQFFSTGWHPRKIYWVFDIFNGQKKLLILDWSELHDHSARSRISQTSQISLNNIHFIDDEKCLLFVRRPESYIISANFNMTTCTMKLGEYRCLAETHYYSLFADSQSVGLLEGNLSTRTTQYMTVNLNDDLMFENRLDLGPMLWLKYATRRDGMLIGFREDGRPTDLQSLFTISLTDGSVSTRSTTVAEEVSRALCPYVSYVWMKDKLFTYAPSDCYSMSTIYVFDLKTLEWKDTGVQVDGEINHMSSADDKILIVNVMSNFQRNCIEVYRIPIFGPDSMLNLSWMSARRRAQSEPEYYNQSLQKLPTNCSLRCPWQDDSQ